MQGTFFVVVALIVAVVYKGSNVFATDGFLISGSDVEQSTSEDFDSDQGCASKEKLEGSYVCNVQKLEYKGGEFVETIYGFTYLFEGFKDGLFIKSASTIEIPPTAFGSCTFKKSDPFTAGKNNLIHI